MVPQDEFAQLQFAGGERLQQFADCATFQSLGADALASVDGGADAAGVGALFLRHLYGVGGQDDGHRLVSGADLRTFVIAATLAGNSPRLRCVRRGLLAVIGPIHSWFLSLLE